MWACRAVQTTHTCNLHAPVTDTKQLAANDITACLCTTNKALASTRRKHSSFFFNSHITYTIHHVKMFFSIARILFISYYKLLILSRCKTFVALSCYTSPYDSTATTTYLNYLNRKHNSPLIFSHNLYALFINPYCDWKQLISNLYCYRCSMHLWLVKSRISKTHVSLDLFFES